MRMVTLLGLMVTLGYFPREFCGRGDSSELPRQSATASAGVFLAQNAARGGTRSQ
jgi:hypothetical protein